MTETCSTLRCVNPATFRLDPAEPYSDTYACDAHLADTARELVSAGERATLTSHP